MSYVQERSTFRATSGLMLALAVQAAMLLALKNGLVPHWTLQERTVTELVPIPIPKSPPKPPAKPHVIEGADRTVVPLPKFVPIPFDEETPTAPVPQLPPYDSDGSGPDLTPTPAVTQVRVDPRYPLTRPDYPPAAIREGKTGKVTLLIYVLPDGRVGDVKIDSSSGSARLDAAAIREAKRSWRFLPATSDGVPIASWGTFAVVFTLGD